MESAESQQVIAAILAFMFAQNKKEHPMPAARADGMFQKIRNLIQRNEEKENG